MWLLMALFGAALASGVTDLSARFDRVGLGGGRGSEEVSDDTQDNETTARDPEPSGDETEIIDHAEPEPEPGPDHGEEGQTDDTVPKAARRPPPDGLPFEVDPVPDVTRDPWMDGWRDDEFVSTDTPPPDPEGQRLSLDDEGGALIGSRAGDTLTGGAGNDWIEGGGGDDLILGGAGDDTLIGGIGRTTLIGGTGNDRLIAGGGTARMHGGDGDDWLTGAWGSDTLFGGAGDDTLEGGAGDDMLVAGTGANLLEGGWGNDTLVGVTLDDQGRDIGGADTLNGGEGADLLILGDGDLAHGGEGADTFVLGDWMRGDDPARITDFAPGEDRILLYSSAGASAPGIAVHHDSETGWSAVSVNGQTVARVLDPTGNLTAADIEVTNDLATPNDPAPQAADGTARAGPATAAP
jgi:Ca2+-binding RTX toxin-like protein